MEETGEVFESGLIVEASVPRPEVSLDETTSTTTTM